MKKSIFRKTALLAVLGLSLSQFAHAGNFDKNNQVFFRGSYSYLTSDRGGEVFTDTLNTAGSNNSKSGFGVAGGLDLGLTGPESVFNVASLAGEIMVEYSRFSQKTVRQTTSALLAGTNNSAVSVAELAVDINPKIKFDTLGRVRPFLVPIGLSFLVNSPPSNDSTYIDLGVNFAAGVDFKVSEWLSLGIDARYTHGFEESNTNTSYFSTGGRVGIPF